MQIAEETDGFLGADLAGLCAEAGLECIRERIYESPTGLDAINISDSGFRVKQRHFKHASSVIKPSGMRDLPVQHSLVKFDDIGGMAKAKSKLRDTIENSMLFPGLLQKLALFYFCGGCCTVTFCFLNCRYGLRPSSGLLLYGPPGCGKTLVAKAIASHCKAHLIVVKGYCLSLFFARCLSTRNHVVFASDQSF